MSSAMFASDDEDEVDNPPYTYLMNSDNNVEEYEYIEEEGPMPDEYLIDNFHFGIIDKIEMEEDWKVYHPQFYADYMNWLDGVENPPLAKTFRKCVLIKSKSEVSSGWTPEPELAARFTLHENENPENGFHEDVVKEIKEGKYDPWLMDFAEKLKKKDEKQNKGRQLNGQQENGQQTSRKRKFMEEGNGPSSSTATSPSNGMHVPAKPKNILRSHPAAQEYLRNRRAFIGSLKPLPPGPVSFEVAELIYRQRYVDALCSTDPERMLRSNYVSFIYKRCIGADGQVDKVDFKKKYLQIEELMKGYDFSKWRIFQEGDSNEPARYDELGSLRLDERFGSKMISEPPSKKTANGEIRMKNGMQLDNQIQTVSCMEIY